MPKLYGKPHRFAAGITRGTPHSEGIYCDQCGKLLKPGTVAVAVTYWSAGEAVPPLWENHFIHRVEDSVGVAVIERQIGRASEAARYSEVFRDGIDSVMKRRTEL